MFLVPVVVIVLMIVAKRRTLIGSTFSMFCNGTASIIINTVKCYPSLVGQH